MIALPHRQIHFSRDALSQQTERLRSARSLAENDPILSDLKMQFVVDGQDLAGSLYAKVVATAVGDATTFFGSIHVMLARN